MALTLKSHQIPDKARSYVDSLQNVAPAEREKDLTKFKEDHPHEESSVLEGFYFLIQQAVQARNGGDSEVRIDLSGDFLFDVIKKMKEKKVFFSYPTGQEFFEKIVVLKPPLFKNYNQVNAALKIFFPPKPKVNPEYNFPEEYNESVLNKIVEICGKTQEAYQQLLHILSVMRNSHKVREKYAKKDRDVTPLDVEVAKETFKETSQNYMGYAKVINDGLPYVHQAFLLYPREMLLHQIYNKYLAKYLVSKETKSPDENYVFMLAEGEFSFKLPDFTPTEIQEQKGFTEARLKQDYKDDLNLVLHRLECRVKKRNLTTLIKKGKTTDSVIKELEIVAKRDPDDIRTHIYLAKLFQKQMETVKNPIERMKVREKALNACEDAFSRIDVFLDLQGIENVKERDIQRVGFVKTISAIRIPLVRGGA